MESCSTPILSLKVKFGDDYRRLGVNYGIVFDELHQLIAKHLALPRENVLIKYIDDEEEVRS